MFQVYVFPLNIKGGSASPSRVVAVWDEEKPTCGATNPAASILLIMAAAIYSNVFNF